MSSIALSGNASGAGVFTIASPNSASSYTATLPAATTTLVGTDATQTLTNKTIQGGAITSGTAVASTSGTSIDFTGIPSWVKRITVMFNGVSTSGTSNLLVRLGSGSIDSASYSSAGLTQNSGGTLAAPTDTSGFLAGYFQANTNTVSGTVVITNISGNVWVHSTAVSFAVAAIIAGGTKTLSGTLDRIRITTVNGTDTFDAGSINILYE